VLNKITNISHSGGYYRLYTEFGETVSTGTAITNLVISRLTTSQYETLPWQDIIGDPANIATTFPDGVYGQWIPVIPDNTSKVFEANKKNLLSGTVEQFYTNDDGATWITNTPAFDNVINGRDVPYGLGLITLWIYPTPANPYVLANNAEVIGELGDVFAFSFHNTQYGGSLGNGLLSKVLTSNVSKHSISGYHLDGYLVTDKLQTNSDRAPTHKTLDLANGNSPTVKAFPYITQENSQYYLQWVYKEMIWDTTLDDSTEFTDIAPATVIGSVTDGQGLNVTSGDLNGYWISQSTTNHTTSFDSDGWVEVDGKLYWSNSGGAAWFKRWNGNGFGDDNKFNIVNGESTVLDDNGNAVIVGQKRVTLPFFTGKAS